MSERFFRPNSPILWVSEYGAVYLYKSFFLMRLWFSYGTVINILGNGTDAGKWKAGPGNTSKNMNWLPGNVDGQCCYQYPCNAAEDSNLDASVMNKFLECKNFRVCSLKLLRCSIYAFPVKRVWVSLTDLLICFFYNVLSCFSFIIHRYLLRRWS